MSVIDANNCAAINLSGISNITVNTPSLSVPLSNGVYVWTGSNSIEWQNPLNWIQWNGVQYELPNIFPNSNIANVILPNDAVGTCIPREARIGNITVSVNNITAEQNHVFGLNNSNSVLNIHGAYTGGTWSIPTNGSKVSYCGNVNQEIRIGTYFDLSTGGSGIKSNTTGLINVRGQLFVASGTTLSMGTGNIRLSAPGTPFVIEGNFQAGNGSVRYRSVDGDQNIAATTYYRIFLEQTGGRNITGKTIVTDLLSNLSGTSLNLGSDTIYFTKTSVEPFINTGVFNAQQSTVVFSGNGFQGIPPVTYNNVLTQNNGDKILLGNVIINGNLRLERPMFIDNFTLTLNGNDNQGIVNNLRTNLTSTLILNNAGSSSFQLQSSSDIGTLRINAANKVFALSNNLKVHTSLELENGLLDLNGFHLQLLNNANLSRNLGTINASNALCKISILNNLPLTIPNNLFLNNRLNKLTVNGSGGILLDSDLIIEDSLSLVNGTVDLSNKTLTMGINAKWWASQGRVNTSNARVVYKGQNMPTNVLSVSKIKHLEIDCSQGVSLFGNLEVDGEFKLTNGTLNISNNTLKLSGTLLNSIGSVNASNGTVQFNNSNEWELNSQFFAGDVKNLSISGEGGIRLGAPTRVVNVLDFANGKIISSNTALLEIGTGINTTGDIICSSTSNARIIGPVKRWYGTSASLSASKGVMPVGIGNVNRTVQINFNQASQGGYIITQYLPGEPTINYQLPLTYGSAESTSYIESADKTGYWSITPYSAQNVPYGSLDDIPFILKLRINQPDVVANGNILPNPPTMRIIRAKGNPVSLEHANWTVGAVDANIIEVTPNTNENFDYLVEASLVGFSWFNIGGDASTPLPVELLSFAGECIENDHVLTWKTASEHNSQSFEVQSSRDGLVWNTVNTQVAAGNSNSLLTYNFIQPNVGSDTYYYRLNQIDFNGESKMYDPILVSCASSSSVLMTYPNPSDVGFNLIVKDDNLVGSTTVTITDSKGKLVAQRTVEILDGTNMIRIEEPLAAGMYYLQLQNGTNSSKLLKHVIH
jgi:hypothetical protein